MAMLGKIVVGLQCNTAAFAAGLKRAQSQIGRFVGKMTSVASMARAFVAGAAVNKVLELAENIDQTAKAAERMGMRQSDLEGFRLAARRIGLESEDADTALEKFVKTMADASAKGGADARIFGQLGLSFDRIAAMAPADAFKATSDAIAGLKNPLDRAAAAQELFGKSGQRLVDFVSLGTGKLGDFKQEAIDLGLAMNDWDVSRIQAFTDSTEKLKDTFKGLAIDVMPLVVKAIDAVKIAVKMLSIGFTEIGVGIETIGLKSIQVARWLRLPGAEFLAGAETTLKRDMEENKIRIKELTASMAKDWASLTGMDAEDAEAAASRKKWADKLGRKSPRVITPPPGTLGGHGRGKGEFQQVESFARLAQGVPGGAQKVQEVRAPVVEKILGAILQKVGGQGPVVAVAAGSTGASMPGAHWAPGGGASGAGAGSRAIGSY